VDPLKDINAAVIAIENRLQSRTGVVADNGGDFPELLNVIAEEERMAEEKGVSLPRVEPPLAQIEDEAPAEQANGKGNSTEANGENGERPKGRAAVHCAGFV
jgi:capsid protein